MIARSVLTLLELYDQHYQPEKLAGGRAATDRAYRGAIRRLEATLGRTVYEHELCDELLLEYRKLRLATKIRRRGKMVTRSNATINRDERHLRALGNFARRRGRIDWRPDLESLREMKRSAVAWDFAGELPRLFAAIAREPGEIGGFPVHAVLSGLAALLLYTGCRITVAMMIAPEAISLPRRTVRLPAELQKQVADQELLLHDTALEYLRPLLGGPKRTYLIPWPYDRWDGCLEWPTLNGWFREILARARLDDGGPRLFHKFRVTCATQLFIETGGDIDAVRRQLGHSTNKVTWTYIDTTKTAQRSAALLLPAMQRPGAPA